MKETEKRIDWQSVFSQATPTAASRLQTISSIRAGFSVALVEQAVEAAHLQFKELADYGVIPRRTLSHSQKRGKFSPKHSDNLLRFFRIYAKVTETFGSPEKAKRWLERKTRAFDDQRPIDLLDTEEGTRLVEEVLHRIDHGLGS